MTTKNTAPGAEAPDKPSTEAPANVAVEALVSGLKIGGAIVARGRVDFPLTDAQAKQLESLKQVRILGIWK